jgi:hypothetical protein
MPRGAAARGKDDTSFAAFADLSARVTEGFSAFIISIQHSNAIL